MTNSGLPDLRELDLDGNPCAQSRGYKHRVLGYCPRLLELDGEELNQLDRDLSSLFFEEQVSLCGPQYTFRGVGNTVVIL